MLNMQNLLKMELYLVIALKHNVHSFMLKNIF